MDADLSHDPADLAAAARRGARRRRRPRARLALRRRRRRRGLGRAAARASAAAAPATRARVLGVGVRDLTGGFKCFRADVLRGDRPADRALAGLRVPGRADLPRARARASASSRCRSSSATASAGDSKMSWRIAARGGLARARAAARPPARPRLPEAAGSGARGDPCRSDAGMKTEQLALVQGWATRAPTLRRWNAAPAAVLAPWALGAASPSPCCCWRAVLADRARSSTPDPSRLPAPRRQQPGDLGDYGFVLFRNALVLALHALACVAGFIAGCSLPHEAEQLPRLVAQASTSRPARWRSRFVAAATLFSLATQAYVARQRRRRRSPPSSASRRGCSCSASCPHALPELFALFLPLAAWTIASRRQALGRAARRDRSSPTAIAVPCCSLAARRRGLRLAAAAARSRGCACHAARQSRLAILC